MKTLCIALAALLSIGSAAHAGDIKLAWDAPTNNVDGSPLIDLAGYRVRYVPVVVAYSEATNGVITWMVVSTSAAPTTVWTTNTSLALTIPSTVYSFTVAAVAGLGVESAPSSNVLSRVGSPTTLKLQRVK
jgi:hypothetical protein